MKLTTRKLTLYMTAMLGFAMLVINRRVLQNAIVEEGDYASEEGLNSRFQQMPTHPSAPLVKLQAVASSNQTLIKGDLSKPYQLKPKVETAAKSKQQHLEGTNLEIPLRTTEFNTSGRPQYLRSHPNPIVYGNFKAKPIINHFPFDYLINVKNACHRRKVRIMIPVHSAVTNFERRMMMRNKIHQFTNNPENEATMLFFVGIPSSRLKDSAMFQQKVINESNYFHDIVQINSTDIYHNILNKAMAVLHWVLSYCGDSEIVLKLDDDVTINPPRLLMSIYQKLVTYTDFIIGELRINRFPFRSTKRKSYLSVEEYPGDKFPPFVPGPAVGYPTSTARLLYQQALRTRVVWLDDLFLMGICREALGIPIFNDTNFQVSVVHKMLKAPNFVYI